MDEYALDMEVLRHSVGIVKLEYIPEDNRYVVLHSLPERIIKRLFKKVSKFHLLIHHLYQRYRKNKFGKNTVTTDDSDLRLK